MAEPHPRLRVEEYLAFERRSEEKHEFLDGEVFAMTGASRQHNRIAFNLVEGILYTQLQGRTCDAFVGATRFRRRGRG